MRTKQFKAESKRLLELMINSIYTHREIFLRELISNASDAIDKLYYHSLSENLTGLSRDDFSIELALDKDARTLTITDNGCGMTKDELESNLGTIAKSGSLAFKQEEDGEHKEDIDIIGQFGVGFYSAFMVASRVTVYSRPYGSDEAWKWESRGVEGYTIEPCEMDGHGTKIVLTLKENEGEENYDEFLDPHRVSALVKRYSDYIRYPIRMDMPARRLKEGCPEDKPEYEDYTEHETLNSMVPIWKKNKSELKDEDYNNFYKEKYFDFEDPALVIHSSTEGAATYNALLFIPARAPFNYYSRDYEKGLQLYASGVLIMDRCADLLPDCFSFVKGLVDSQDLSLNISREMLQHTRVLQVISGNLEKKVKAELLKLQKDDREKYEQFYSAFGRQLKYGVVSDYGAHKDMLKDLLLFWSSREGKNTSLAEYAARMAEDQPSIYFLCAESVEKAAKLPQAERVLDKGYEILYLTDEVDEFVMNTLSEWDGKPFKNVCDDDALPESDEEKAQAEKKAEENKDVLDFVKETLGERIKEVRISKILKSAPVCMSADGPVSLEMEKYFQRVDPQAAKEMKAGRVLELNPDSGAFAALRAALEGDKERARTYAELLYDQALLIAGLPLEDPAAYTELVCSLMQ